MRRLYSLLIYATMILAVATVWAMGKEFQAKAALTRAQNLAAVPQFNEELARLEAAEAAEAAAAAQAHPAAAPATRPALRSPTPDPITEVPTLNPDP